jgi:hypothetical protein
LAEALTRRPTNHNARFGPPLYRRNVIYKNVFIDVQRVGLGGIWINLYGADRFKSGPHKPVRQAPAPGEQIHKCQFALIHS